MPRFGGWAGREASIIRPPKWAAAQTCPGIRCDLLGKWANDPQVRANAFSTDLIPLEDHDAWFTARMADQNCLILIAENYDGAAVGQLRVDWRSLQDGEIK